MPYSSRPRLLLTLLTLTGAASWAQAAGSVPGPGGTTPPGLSSAATQGDTVTVRPGDTAYSLARAHGLTVEGLLALNGLTSPDLRVGQVLRVQQAPPYIVRRGDTLYSLARHFGTSVDGLLALNSLPQDALLEIGQVLRVPPPGPGAPAPLAGPVLAGPTLANPVLPPAPVVVPAGPPPAADPVPPVPAPGEALAGDWRNAALALLGVPYVYGGSTPGGLDCSGFVVQVFAPLGVQLPRRSADQARAGVPVSPAELQPGDLVFFDTAGRGEVTHVGIYLGDDQFVNANSFRGQVGVDHLLGDAYWAPRLLGARRVLPATVSAYGVGH